MDLDPRRCVVKEKFQFPILETSATALCGTTGIMFPYHDYLLEVSFKLSQSRVAEDH